MRYRPPLARRVMTKRLRYERLPVPAAAGVHLTPNAQQRERETRVLNPERFQERPVIRVGFIDDFDDECVFHFF